MYRSNGVSGAKRSVVIIAAIIALLTAAVIALSGNSIVNGGTAYAETPASSPFYSYTSLDVTQAEGYDIYKGVTTVKGVKNNITVTGKYTVGAETKERVLTHDEYIIKVTKGEDQIAMPENDPIVGADEDIQSVALVVESGKAVADLPLNIAAEVPAAPAGSLTVSLDGDLTDDHTASSVVKLLTVMSGDTELRSDLYTVELSPETLSVGSSATVTVKSIQDPSVEGSVTATVKAAALKGVDLRVAGDITLDGLFYKRNGKDVFTRLSSNKKVFENNLVITAVYENSVRVIEPAFNTYGQLDGVAPNVASRYNLSIDDRTEIAENESSRAVKITLSTIGAYPSDECSATLNINFAVVDITEIIVDKNKFNEILANSQYADRTPYTGLSVNAFASAITFVYNNGDTTQTMPEGTAFAGTLTPTADDIKQFIESGRQYYSKDITVTLTKSDKSVISSEPITVDNIKYESPTSIGSDIAGNLPEQVMHKAVDYGNMTVKLYYGEVDLGDGDMSEAVGSVDMPLSDFKDNGFIKTTITKGDTAPDGYVSYGTTRISVRFAYNDGKFNGQTKNIGTNFSRDQNLKKDPVAAPELDTSSIVFSENNCFKIFKDLSQLRYGAVNFGHDFGMGVQVFTQYGSSWNLSNDEEAVYDEATGRINFKAGGTYKIKVSLDSADVSLNEYTLTSGSSNIQVSTDGSYAEYTIVVEKGALSIGVSSAAAGNILYGDDIDLTVNGTIGGRPYILVNTEDGSGLQNGQLAVPYKLVFVKADNDTYMPDKYDYASYDLKSEPFYNSVTGKINAGEYHVYAVTKETTAYLASKSRVGAYVQIEILKKELSFSSVTSLEYAQKGYTADDFITGNDVFVSPDTADDVLLLTYTADGVCPPVTVVGGKYEFLHVGVYSVDIAVSEAYAVNYKLADGQPTTVDFEITQKELSFTYINGTGWKYGTKDPEPVLNYGLCDGFYATVSDDIAYYEYDGTATVGDPIDTAVKPFGVWNVGRYAAVYTVEYTTEDEKAYKDYTLPPLVIPFSVTQATVAKITVVNDDTAQGNWTADSASADWVGQYGKDITATLSGYKSDNTMPADGGKIVTVTVGGMRLDPNESENIPDVYLADAFDYGSDNGKLTLTQAGSYTVTITLDKNYLWDDGTNTDIVYYGKIYKKRVSDITLPPNAVYDGTVQTQTVKYSLTGETETGWYTDHLYPDVNVAEIVSVSGESVSGKDISLGASEIHNDIGGFDVIKAGEYSVKLALTDKNNYEWLIGGVHDTDDKTETFTVTRAVFKTVWYKEADGEMYLPFDDPTLYPSYEYDETAAEQSKPICAPYTDHEPDRVLLEITSVKYYSDAACNTEVSSVNAAQIYYAKVVEIGGDASDNYTLDGIDLKLISIKFEIVSPALAAPMLIADDDISGNSIQKTFKNGDYDFAEFISNYSEYTNSDGTVKRVVIEIDGEEKQTVKNVKFTGADVSAYTVTVRPAPNYEWKTAGDGAALSPDQIFTYTFTVSKLTVRLKWTGDLLNGGFEYGDGKDHTPAVDFADDFKPFCDGAVSLSLTLTDKDGSEELTLAQTANAGVYKAAARLVDGGNYTLDGVAENDLAREFTVKKAVLATPVANYTGLIYSGDVQTLEFGDWTANTNFGSKLTASVSGSNVINIPIGDLLFDNATGVLSYIHAGEYTVKFTLNESTRKNYCWTAGGQTVFGEGADADKEETFTVARKTLTAPALGDQRAIKLVSEQTLYKPQNIAADKPVKDGTKDVFYTVCYGIYDYNGGDPIWTDRELTVTTRGTVYYVKLTIDGISNAIAGGTFDPYDYLWVENVADKQGMSFVSPAPMNGVWGKVDGNGIDLYLSFVITKQQVGALFEFEGYTFGDNGYQNDADLRRYFDNTGLTFGKLFAVGNSEDPNNKLKLTYKPDTVNYGDGAQSILDLIIAADPVVTVTFYKGETLLGDGELVNGLPWAAGRYRAHVSVTFDTEGSDDSDYNEFGGDAEFTVGKLLASVEWSDTASAVYNGQEQTRAAKVIRLPKNTAESFIAEPKLVITKVKNVAYTDGKPAAQTVEITDIDDENFTIEGLVNNTAEFTLTPAVVSVTGRSYTQASDNAHVYGDAVPNVGFDITAGGFFEDKEYIVARILDGTDPIRPDSPVGNAYIVVPMLADIDGAGNYELDVTVGSFEIVKRRLTVEFGRLSSVYGSELIDLYAAAVHTSENGSGAGVISGDDIKDILEFKAVDANGNEIDKFSDITTETNKYTVSCRLRPGVSDYSFDQSSFGTFYYELTAADITINKVIGYSGTYDAKSHNLFDAAAVTVNPAVKPTWEFSEDGDVWTPYVIGADGVADAVVRNVNDAYNNKTYFVRVNAKNHKTVVFGNAEGENIGVHVRIVPKQANVSVNITIKYGDLDPTDISGTLYKGTVADLRAAEEGSIYTVGGLIEEDRTLFYGAGLFYGLENGTFGYGYGDKAYDVGKDVGEYPLIFDGADLGCANYDFVNVTGTLIVEKLPVTLSIKDFRAVYGQTDPEKPQITDVTAITQQRSMFADTLIAIPDGIETIVKNLMNPALDEHAEGVTTNTANRDGEWYDIEAEISDNYDFSGALGKYVISRAQNGFLLADYTLFKGAPSFVSTVTENAWIYGDRSETHAYGYDPDGRHELNSPQLIDHSGVMTVTVTRMPKQLLQMEVAAGNGEGALDVIKSLFDGVHKAAAENSFYAGDYRINYYMPETDNYDAFTYALYFKVGKKDLTVAPVSAEIVYGEDISERSLIGDTVGAVGTDYPYIVKGLVNNGGVPDAIDDIVSFGISSDYEAGYENGSAGIYGIKVKTVNGAPVEDYDVSYGGYKHVNYNVVFGSGELNVTPREIEIEIDDRVNYYKFINYKNGAYDVNEKFTDYTFALGSDIGFADGDGSVTVADGRKTGDNTSQLVFVMRSAAVTDVGGKLTTANVGRYAIYVTAGARYVSKHDATLFNYTVTVGGSFAGALDPDYQAIANAAGTHIIEKANLNITIDETPYKDAEFGEQYTGSNWDIYDGVKKYFKVETSLPLGVFTEEEAAALGELKYFVGNAKDHTLYGDGKDAPKDAGDYYVEYEIKDPNFEAQSANNSYKIKRKRITIGQVKLTSSVPGSISTEDGKPFFNGGSYTYTYAFNDVVAGEFVNLTYKEDNRLSAGKEGLGIDEDAFLICGKDIKDNVFSVRIQNSGIYNITVTLADRTGNGFSASNYSFDDRDAQSYTFDTFEILPERLIATTGSVSVQYGSEIGASDRCSELKVSYRSEHYEARTEQMMSDEKAMGQLVIPTEYTREMFYTKYAPASSVWGGTYDMTLIPGTVTAYNFTVVPSGNKVVSLAARQMTVKVSGYIDGTQGNKNAACVYTGQGETVNHNIHVTEALTKYRSDFLEIISGNEGFVHPDGSGWKDPLDGVVLKISINAKTVGKYPLAPSVKSGYPMYQLSFVNADELPITGDLENEDNIKLLPRWYIEKAELRVAVGKYDPNATYANLVTEFGAPYGTDAAYRANSTNSTFSIRYDGWVSGEGDSFGPAAGVSYNHAEITSCIISNGDGIYAPWMSVAGSSYTVKPVTDAVLYDNYVIVAVPGTMTVEPLPVTAVASPVVYSEIKDESGNIVSYNGGKSGAEHHVLLKFNSASDGIILPESGFAQFDYVATYSDSANKPTNSANANKQSGAPIIAGDYFATVTFKRNSEFGRYNYIFADGDTQDGTEKKFTHKVNKQLVQPRWKESGIFNSSTASQTNSVVNYVHDIMEFVSFSRNDSQVSDYTAGADGFNATVKPDAVGTYRLQLRFNAYAAVNYCWITSDEVITVTFRVVTEGGKVEIVGLSIGDWTYLGDAKEPSSKLSPDVGGIITYTYASADRLDIDSILTMGGAVDNRVVGADVCGDLVYNGTVPQDAGWYIVCASYAGSDEYAAAAAYYLFRINKFAVGAPVLGIITEGENKNDMFTGSRLSADVMHNAQAYITSFDGDRSAISGGTRLFVTNANVDGYTVRFALLNSSNYMWDADDLAKYPDIQTETVNGTIVAVMLKWHVARADVNDIIWNDSLIWNEQKQTYELTYGDAYSIAARATYTNAVRYLYAADNGTDPSNITAWSTERPYAADRYYIKAECDGNDNYVSAVDYRKIFIDKAVLTAVPYGSMVYGDKFSFGVCDFDLFGYVDAEDARITRDPALIRYSFVDGTLNTDALDANPGYALTMAVDGDGYVVGVTSPNYYIVLRNGVFAVEQKRVTVGIGSGGTSVYLENIDPSGVTLTALSGLDGDPDTAQITELLKVVLEISAKKGDTVGRYTVNARSLNGNYAVEFIAGEYTITELRVRIEISAGGGEYEGNITEAKVEHIYTVNAAENKDIIGSVELKFSYRYSGRSYSGVAYNGDVPPTLAGTYIATVTGIVNDSNYILDLSAGDVSVPFIITKKVIDAGKLKVDPKLYTGSPLIPEITDGYYNINGETIYTVLPHGDFVDGGTYTFTLELTDEYNYKWLASDVAVRDMNFVIAKADNSLVAAEPGDVPVIEIKGWTFGKFDADVNMPEANVKYGNELIVFTYAPDRNGPYTTAIPSNGKAGDYWVRVTVRETANYNEFVSEPFMFTIDKLRLTAPTLETVTEGKGKNDVYTGGELSSLVLGFDSVLMGVYYDGSVNLNGSKVTVFAVNAGYYEVKISVKDPVNYRWADGTQCDENGNAVLSWTVARKKVAKPVHNSDMLIVNGSILEYIPNGFDGKIMNITDNKSGYGGTFTATVTLADTDNYEWSDGSTDALKFTWKVVGSHTVFIAVIASLSGVAGALGIVALVQFLRYRKKKKAENGKGVA